jgi:phosphoglycolate phosphatase
MVLTPKLIVFDCDGTLIDSQHVIAEAMRLTFSGAGLASPERDAVIRTVGLSIPEALSTLAPEQPSELLGAMASSYREWHAALRQQTQMQEPMFNGAAELLKDLAGRDDVILGVATGKSRRGVMRFVERNNLHGVFATVQTADDAPSKPHPAMLLQAMCETGARPETTIMVGDTSYDMVMAACADVASVGVSWGYHSTAELKKSGARHIATSFSALSRILAAQDIFEPRYEAVA